MTHDYFSYFTFCDRLDNQVSKITLLYIRLNYRESKKLLSVSAAFRSFLLSFPVCHYHCLLSRSFPLPSGHFFSQFKIIHMKTPMLKVYATSENAHTKNRSLKQNFSPLKRWLKISRRKVTKQFFFFLIEHIDTFNFSHVSPT